VEAISASRAIQPTVCRRSRASPAGSGGGIGFVGGGNGDGSGAGIVGVGGFGFGSGRGGLGIEAILCSSNCKMRSPLLRPDTEDVIARA
jgi:hypothetical protein